MVRSGQLRDRVELIRDTSARSASGGTQPWSDYDVIARLWADVEPRRGGREQIGTVDWPAGRVPYDITVRYRSDFTEKDRFLFDGRQFHIDAVPRGARRQEFITVPCTEVN